MARLAEAMSAICIISTLILSPATLIGLGVIGLVIWAGPKIWKAWEEMDE